VCVCGSVALWLCVRLFVQPDGFRESEALLKQSDASLPSATASNLIDGIRVEVDALSWYMRTSIAALMLQLSRADKGFGSSGDEESSCCPKVLSESS
jgi:hypothetical protein